MPADSFYCFIGNKPRTAVSRMNPVLGILGIRYACRNSVKHFVKCDKFIRKLNRNPVYNFKFFIEKLAHSQLIGCGKKERLKKNDDYPRLFKLFN